jgi:DNA-directed RNA polymerase II subunit RPB1
MRAISQTLREKRVKSEDERRAENARDALQVLRSTLETAEVRSTELSLLSFEDMEKLKVCEITRSEIGNEKEKEKVSKYGHVNDPRMGTLGRGGSRCETCFNVECPGHYGLINFYRPIFNPIFTKYINWILNSVCPYCSTPFISRDVIEREYAGMNIEKTLRLLAEKSSTVICDNDECYANCKKEGKEIIQKYLKDEHGKDAFGGFSCKSPPFELSDKKLVDLPCKLNASITTDGKFKNVIEKGKEVCYPTEIARIILSNISESDARLMGFVGGHPKDLVLKGILVIPPVARPSTTKGQDTKNDIKTDYYIDVVKANNTLGTLTNGQKNIDIYDKHQETAVTSLYNAVKTLFKSDDSSRYGRDPASLLRSMMRKDGIIRNLLMGKPSDECARAVITPDPSIKFNQVGLPLIIAETLSLPERVFSANLQYAQKLLDDDRVLYVTRAEGPSKGIPRTPHRGMRLKIGDTIHRKLRDGDIVFANRQPTLHRPSMMAFEVVIRKSQAAGLHPSHTTPFNADFDGDEMNFWVPQDAEARAEAITLSTPGQCLTSSETAGMYMGLIMDSITSAHHLSFVRGSLSKEHFEACYNSIIKKPGLLSIKDLQAKGLSLGVTPRSGRLLFSALLPPDFNFRLRTLVIRKGILQYGELNTDNIAAILWKIAKKVEKETKASLQAYSEFEEVRNNVIFALGGVFKVGTLSSPADVAAAKFLLDLNSVVSTYNSLSGGSTFDIQPTQIEDSVLLTDLIDETIYNACVTLIIRTEDLPSLDDRLAKFSVPKHSGRGLFSALLPAGFYYSQGTVQIKDGIFISGFLTKAHVGPSPRSIIQDIHYFFGPDRAGDFITDATWVLNRYITLVGHSVSLDDYLPPQEVREQFEREMQETIIKQEEVVRTLEEEKATATTEDHRRFLEQKEVGILKGLTAMGVKKLRDFYDFVANPLLWMFKEVGGGAKGDIMGLAQASSMAGQQLYRQARPEPMLGARERCLPTRSPYDPDPEARGFCPVSYTKGLNPEQAFFAQYASREALIISSLATSDAGDMRRKLVMSEEDIVSQNDGSVRTIDGQIIQVIYGDMGLDVSKLVKIKYPGNNQINSPVDLRAITFSVGSKFEEGLILPVTKRIFGSVEMKRLGADLRRVAEYIADIIVRCSGKTIEDIEERVDLEEEILESISLPGTDLDIIYDLQDVFDSFFDDKVGLTPVAPLILKNLSKHLPEGTKKIVDIGDPFLTISNFLFPSAQVQEVKNPLSLILPWSDVESAQVVVMNKVAYRSMGEDFSNVVGRVRDILEPEGFFIFSDYNFKQGSEKDLTRSSDYLVATTILNYPISTSVCTDSLEPEFMIAGYKPNFKLMEAWIREIEREGFKLIDSVSEDDIDSARTLLFRAV